MNLPALLIIAAVSQPAGYVHSPLDAIGWAAVEIEKIPESQRPTTRFLYIPHHAESPAAWMQAASFVLNSLGNSRVDYRPRIGVRGWLLVLNCSEIWPEQKPLAKALAAWDQLAVRGSHYHILDSETAVGQRATISSPVLFGPDQNIGELWRRLQLATATESPIFSVDHFIANSLDQFDDGLYLSFVLPEGVKNESEIFELFAGLTPAQMSDLNGIGRAIVQSKVTGKWRRIDAGTGPGIAGAMGVQWARTIDVSDTQARDASRNHALLSPVVQRTAAKEILFFDGIRMRSFLTDGKGVLQDEAPPDVAADIHSGSTTKRLQAGYISCLRCHGPNTGWQPFENVLATSMTRGLLIFDDLELDPLESRDTLEGLYLQNLNGEESFFGRSRRDYDYAVLRQTQLKFEQDGQPLTIPGVRVPRIAEIVSEIYASYRYDMITPLRAAQDLGWNVSAEDAPGLLMDLWAEAGSEIHPFLSLLQKDIANIYPSDWAKVKIDAAALAYEDHAVVIPQVTVPSKEARYEDPN